MGWGTTIAMDPPNHLAKLGEHSRSSRSPALEEILNSYCPPSASLTVREIILRRAQFCLHWRQHVQREMRNDGVRSWWMLVVKHDYKIMVVNRRQSW